MTGVNRRIWIGAVLAASVSAVAKGSASMKLGEEVERVVWPVCDVAFAGRGFVHDGRGGFRKSLSNGISFGIQVDVESRHGSVSADAALMIFHARAMAVVDAGFKARGIGVEDYVSMVSTAIDVRSLRSLLRLFGHAQPALLWFPILDKAAAPPVAAAIVEGVELVADAYFSNAESEEKLIAYFESDRRAGGTANRIHLLSLYYVTRRIAKLRSLLADISPENSAPMTLEFKEYILTRLEKEESKGSE